MKQSYLIAISIWYLLYSCTNTASTQQEELISKAQYPDAEWIKIQSINFQIIQNNDTIPWVNISNPDTAHLFDADKKILKTSRIKLHIDYPLTVTATYPTTSITGFSRKDLIRLISDKYKKIYKAENNSITVDGKTIDKIPNSPAKYGICCHDIADLDLGSVQVYMDESGTIHLILEIES